ncbi:Solute carrier family 35 member F4 [Vulpes lagopus]
MDVKAAPNGVATIEDRILRITGYYGYYPGYSSQKSKTPRGCLAPGAGAGGMREGAPSGHLQPRRCR